MIQMIKQTVFALIAFAFGVNVFASNLPEAKVVSYNNDDLVVDLGVGLLSFPIPYDYDQDGLVDIIVNCPDRPARGLFYFRNIGTIDKPLFDKEIRLSEKVTQHLCCSEYNGQMVVMDKGVLCVDFFNNPYAVMDTVKYEGVRIEDGVRRYRSQMWNAVDWDNDGDMDYVVGFDSWDDYGWDNAFDRDGNWFKGPLHGWVYLVENVDGKYVNNGRVQAAGTDIDVYGAPNPCVADFDEDGDLDIICGEFVDGLTWFENIGTRSEPVFAAGRQLSNAKGEIRFHLQMINPRVCDFNKDGHVDLVVGDEDGRVAFLKNTGKVKKGIPQFESPEYFRQKADKVKFGALATPVAVDWNNDGKVDIVSGNSAGEIAFIENLTGGENPSWAAPVLMKVGKTPIRIQAGYNGSIQGPAEAKWGYTVLNVADWDGDGLKDLVINSIWGKIEWYRNLGKKDGLVFAPAQPVKVAWEGETPKPAWNWWTPEEGTFSTQWRTTPVVIDWNKDGLLDIIMLDHEGYLAYYESFVSKHGKKTLKPGQRIFECVNGCLFRNTKGIIDDTPGVLRLNERMAGASGRRKICMCDWDFDGKIDLIVDSNTAAWFRNVTGNNDETVKFEYMGELSSTRLEGHTTSPTVIDWNNDNVCDLLVGGEDGRFYIVKNPMSYNEVIELYPDRNYEDKSSVRENGYIDNITKPEILVYRPAVKKSNKAVLIVPGGSYNKNCITFEGYKTAAWLNQHGITAFILKYRLPAGNPDVVVEDGRRSMELLREKATEYGINKIGVVGFSAGGHFVSTMVTRFETPAQKPDFAVLVYPVISMKYDNAGTGISLLGDNLVVEGEKWTSTNFVRKDMPVSMILMCSDDKMVPIQQVKDFYNAAIEKGADLQLHFYPKGGHGFWMRDRFKYSSQVYSMVLSWITSL